jgi:molybdopterin converting factor small subunit
MIVTVKLFAAARESIAASEAHVEVPDPATIADVKRALTTLFPQITGLLTVSALAKNHDYALDTDFVSPSDELALIPPVSGG